MRRAVRLQLAAFVGAAVLLASAAAEAQPAPTPTHTTAPPPTPTPTPAATALLITGTGEGGGPHVRTFGANGAPRASFFAYSPGFLGGVRVAAGDVNGDGTAEIITGAGPGARPRVRVFDANGTRLGGFLAYDTGFSGGVFVAAGDVNGDGRDDIIVGTGPGTGASSVPAHVKVFSGATNAELMSFFPYGSFTGGVFVAAGDVNGDGRADVITGADASGGPHVKAFSGATGAEVRSFFAYSPGFLGGVRVAAGDVNGDGIDEIITSKGPGTRPNVRVFDGATGRKLAGFLAYDPAFAGGVFVAGPN